MPPTSEKSGSAASPPPISTAPLPGRTRDETLLGIGIIVLSGVLYSTSDAISKYLAETMPAIEIAWLRWIGFLLIVTPALLRSRFRVLRSIAPGTQILRGICMTGSSVLFIFGLRYLPLADATTLNFVAPIFVTALSIVLLGEVVGIRRWAAVVAGLIGVIIVIRPGGGGFGPAALMPIGSAACWAGGVVLTRKLSGGDGPWTAMAIMAVVGTVILSILVVADFKPVTWHELALVALMVGASGTGQFLTILGFGKAAASVLASFSYVQLVWSTLYGFLLFGAFPDTWTAVGAAVIISSGVYTAHRERVRAREAKAKAA